MATITLTGGCLGTETMRVCCDLREATAPVMADYCMGSGWEPTQYQCADARHSVSGLKTIARELAAAACLVPEEDASACAATLSDE
jgi:hypothetical protein